MTKLLVATHNKGKVKEFAEMLADLDIEWLSLDDVGVTEDVAETGSTFRANSVLKAQAYAAKTGLLTLADDSGLEVDALDGAPGVYTARYGGVGLTAVQRYQKLLDAIKQVPDPQRTARFRCVIVLAHPDGRVLGESEGMCEGQIALAPAGEGGFGYDPVFYLPRFGQTMAQLPPGEKHKISHRGRAVQAIVPRLRELLAG
ncbi:MAG: XTP/dITP diphosphatase [Ardenticatenaceae bacterium]|nr:XTP/dITP diphosphatase [Anaerolineales bacterium]MCB8940311.1 XTP/dITP diphosphatase [Ardenticatenaceae bacterium]MCB8973327.1 XTP/dITP diphosphatase [Ardenticatenaceae bacterium]